MSETWIDQQDAVYATRVTYYLMGYVLENASGYVTASTTPYTLSDGQLVQPEVAYLSKDRYPKLSEGAFPLAPDLAVLIAHRQKTARDMREQVMGYLNSGALIVWVIYPQDYAVDVYRHSDRGGIIVQNYDRNGILTGEGLFIGFQLRVKNIFA